MPLNVYHNYIYIKGSWSTCPWQKKKKHAVLISGELTAKNWFLLHFLWSWGHFHWICSASLTGLVIYPKEKLNHGKWVKLYIFIMSLFRKKQNRTKTRKWKEFVLDRTCLFLVWQQADQSYLENGYFSPTTAALLPPKSTHVGWGKLEKVLTLQHRHWIITAQPCGDRQSSPSEWHYL